MDYEKVVEVMICNGTDFQQVCLFEKKTTSLALSLPLSRSIIIITSGASLLRSEPACVPVYDPKKDYCFKDNVKSDHYCWWPFDWFPEGDWKGVDTPSGGGCGAPCTEFVDFALGLLPETRKQLLEVYNSCA